MRLTILVLVIFLSGCSVEAEAPATTQAMNDTSAEIVRLRAEVRELRGSLDALTVLLQQQMER